MIASVTPRGSQNQDIREWLLEVRWTGNVRPVDPATQRRVLESAAHSVSPTLSPLHAERLREVDSAHHAKQTTRLKPTLRDVRLLTDVALQILQLFATGKCTGAVAEACGVHRTQIVRFRNWMASEHRVNVADVRILADATFDGIRQFVAGAKGGAL